MAQLPTGTVTFLFTDIEGSTERWERQREAMAVALERHNAILSGAIEAHGGHVFKMMGDAFCAAFGDAAAAVDAAIALQRGLREENWTAFAPSFEPLLVRVGLHTGLAELRDGDYFGPPLNRVARLMSAGHGGQVLLSLATQQLVRDRLPDDCELRDLHLHRLKDLRYAEHIFQLIAPGTPMVTTAPNTAQRIQDEAKSVVDTDLLPKTCPYRGLHAFRESDARFFFGREAFTELLVESIEAEPMLGVIGPSGSGKSSVVQAGLVPRLRAEDSDAPWTIAKLRPGSRPFHSVASTLVPLFDSEMTPTDQLVEINKMAEALSAGQVSLQDAVNMVRDRSPGFGRLLLVADQFEELYTLGTEERDQRAFQDLLFEGAFGGNGSGPALRIALTLRADFMGYALAYRPFADAMQKHDVKLGPMNRGELTAAITKPAEIQGRAFESGLVERIMDDVGESSGRLPLLEFALTKLWENQEAGWLTHEAYEGIGRVDGAVARHADAVFDELGEQEKEDARRVFVQMVQPGEGTEDTRRLATREEIGEEDWGLVHRLADARLVTTSRDADERETVEVVHEALIRSWHRLREWMNADRRFRVWQERLRFALRGWEEAGRDDGALLRGVPLAEAEEWLRSRREELSQPEQDFVRAGEAERERREAEREQQRQNELAQAEALAAEQERRALEQQRAASALRRRALFLAGALAASLALAVAALFASQRAKASAALSKALALSANSSNLLAEQRAESALAFALEALYEAGDEIPAEVELAVSNAAYAPGSLRRIQISDEALSGVDLTPDGQRAMTLSGDGGVELWDVSSGEVVWSHDGSATAIALSEVEGIAAFATDDFDVVVIELESGEELTRLEGHTAVINIIRFASSGSRIYTEAKDNTVRMWDVETASELLRLDGHAAKVTDMRPDPDHHRIFTYTNDLQLHSWDSRTGERLATAAVLAGRSTSKGVLAISPDLGLLAIAPFYGYIDLYDIDSLTRLERSIPIVNCTALEFTKDGALISSNTGTIQVWDPETMLETGRLLGGETDVTSIDVEQRLVLSGSGDGSVRLWNLDQPVLAGEIIVPEGNAQAVAISDDGRWILSGWEDGTLRLWDLASRSLIRSMSGHTREVLGVAISPDGSTLASAGFDDQLRIWNASTGRESAHWTHPGIPNAISFSPDGRLIASTGWDSRTAHVWDARSGTEAYRMNTPITAYTSVFGPDGTLYVTFGDNLDTSSIVSIDVVTDRVLRRYSGHNSSVPLLAFLPDREQLVSTAHDRSMRLWGIVSGDEVYQTVFDEELRSLQVMADGKNILVGGYNGTYIWDSERRSVIRSYPGSRGGIFSKGAKINSASGRLVTIAQTDGQIQIWKVHDTLQKLLQWTFANHYIRELTCVERVRYRTSLQCEPDGSVPPPIADRLGIQVDGLEDLEAESLDPEPAQIPSVADELGPTPEPAERGAVEDGSSKGAIVDGRGESWQFEARAGAVMNLRARADAPANGVLDPNEVQEQGLLDTVLVVLDPDGYVLAENSAIYGGYHTDAEIRNLELVQDGIYTVEVHSYLGLTSGPYTLEIESVALAGPVGEPILAGSTIQELAWFGDGRHAIGALRDGSLRVWDTASGTELLRLIGHSAPALSVVLTSDGRTAISSGLDKQLIWWDLASGTVTKRVVLDSAARRIRFNADESRLISGHNSGSVRLLDATTGDELRRFEGHTGKRLVFSVALSPDERYVLSGSADAIEGSFESTMLLWDVDSGELVRRFEGHQRIVKDVDFSTDGKRIVSGGEDGRVILWDAETGEEIRRLGRQSGEVSSVRFVGDATQVLAFGYNDSSLRLLDVETGEERLRFRGHSSNKSRGLAVSPSGGVVTGSSDGRVLVWDLGDVAKDPRAATFDGSGSAFLGPVDSEVATEVLPADWGDNVGVLDADSVDSWSIELLSGALVDMGVTAGNDNEGGEEGAKPNVAISLHAVDETWRMNIDRPESVAVSNFPVARGGNFELRVRSLDGYTGPYTLTLATTQVVAERSETSQTSTSPRAATRFAEADEYELVYGIELPLKAAWNSTGVPYAHDASETSGTFDRVAYYLELESADGEVDWVLASMDAFTDDASQLGVPDEGSGGYFQRAVTNLAVASNVVSVTTGSNLGSGFLEFWPRDYGRINTSGAPGASDDYFDWGDAPLQTGQYGSMQVHHPDSGQTVFAYNNWGGGTKASDIGIGNFRGGGDVVDTDWSFRYNAGDWVARRLEVLVRPGTTPVKLSSESSR